MFTGHSLPLLLFIPFPIGVLSLFFLFVMPETPKFIMITRYVSDSVYMPLGLDANRWSLGIGRNTN